MPLRLRTVGCRLAILFLFVLLATCVPSPSDPLDYGTLCVPADAECPDFVVLEREVTGRNQVDWVVTNTGDSAAVVEVLALVSGTQETGLTEIDPDQLVARRETPPLAPGESRDDRFTPQDLGVREGFVFAVRCPLCTVQVDWVFSTVPRDCFEDEDCPAGWLCDDTAGRCVECLVNADCNEDQTCNLETGRCDPPETTAGCATTSGSPDLLLVLLALVAFRRRRAPAARLVLVARIALTVALLCWTSPATASPPRASLSIGTGARFLSGTLGEQSRRGVGFAIGQELRWRYIGAGIALGTSYFLTAQQPPPLSRQFQTYSVTLGPRFYLPIRWFELAAGGDYRRLGITNNSLVRLTGTRTSFDAVGGQAGFRLRWSGFEIRIEGGAHQLLQLPTTMFSADLLVGFTNPG